VRVRGFVLAAVVALPFLLLTGCGAGPDGGAHKATKAQPGSVSAILARPGPNVVALPAPVDFVPGQARLSFLLLDDEGVSIERPRARVWVASSDTAKPYARTTAALEVIGDPGRADAKETTRIYVAHFSVPRPGIYSVAVAPVGGRPMQADLHIQVRPDPQAPGVGSKALPSRTPTIASTHGNLAKLTTSVPPDTELLRYSVADSLAAHKPFVLVFATPKFCTSRTCGPAVEVVDAVRRRLGSSGVRFIHVEIYKDNNPGLGWNRWVKEWHLPNEPWVFLVGRDGRIKARFEGPVSLGELTAAVNRYLGP
jgi:hypothetical protein